jgi:hypothetical protein
VQKGSCLRWPQDRNTDPNTQQRLEAPHASCEAFCGEKYASITLDRDFSVTWQWEWRRKVLTNSSAITSLNLGAISRNGDVRNVSVDADLFGLTNSHFRMTYPSTNPTVMYQNYTYPSSTTLNASGDFPTFAQSSIATDTPFTGSHFTDANGSSLSAYFQPINSTDYGVVFRNTTGALSGRANIVVCPISSTTQTLV